MYGSNYLLYCGSYCLSGGRLFRATPTGRACRARLALAIVGIVLARTPLVGVPARTKNLSEPAEQFFIARYKGRGKFVINPAFLDRLGPPCGGPCRPKNAGDDSWSLGWQSEARLRSGFDEARTLGSLPRPIASEASQSRPRGLAVG